MKTTYEQLEILIAMKDEALNSIYADVDAMSRVGKKAYSALSISPESLAAWEAEKLEPLRKQVVMLREELKPFAAFECGCGKCHNCTALKAFNDTQAAAEAYMAEHDAKVLEDAAYNAPCDASEKYCNALAQRFRAAAKKGN